MDELTAPDAQACLDACQADDNTSCQWYTYRQEDTTGTCILLQDCPITEDCQECVSGQRPCAGNYGVEPSTGYFTFILLLPFFGHSYCFAPDYTKLLVIAGRNGSLGTINDGQVLDLTGQTTCEPFPDYPFGVEGLVATFIDEQVLLMQLNLNFIEK